jgi:hypothetical protein
MVCAFYRLCATELAAEIDFARGIVQTRLGGQIGSLWLALAVA